MLFSFAGKESKHVGEVVPRSDTEDLPHICDSATLARYLKVDLKTIHALAQRGQIPYRKVGKAYRFFAPAIIAWLTGPHASRDDEK